MSSNSPPFDDGNNLDEGIAGQGEQFDYDENPLELDQQQAGSPIHEQQHTQMLSQTRLSESLSSLMSSGATGTPTPGYELPVGSTSSPSAAEAASSTMEPATAGVFQVPLDTSFVTTQAPWLTNPYATLPFLGNVPAVTDNTSAEAIAQQQSLNDQSIVSSSVYPSTDYPSRAQFAQQQLAASLQLQHTPYPASDAARNHNNINRGSAAAQDMNLIAQQNMILRQILQAQTQIMHQQSIARQQQAFGSIPLVPGQQLPPTSMSFAGGLGLAAAMLPTTTNAASSAQGTLLKRKHPPSSLTGDVDDKPKRPCSAYNLFFKDERKKILKEIEEKEAGEKSKDGSPDDEDDRKLPARKGGKKSDAKSKRELEQSEEGEVTCNMGSNTSEETKRRRRRKPHGKIGFEELAKKIANRWRNIDPKRRLYYEQLAEQEKVRYKEQVAAYMEKQRSGTEAVLERLKAGVSERTKDLQFAVGEKTPPDKRKHKKPKK